MEDTINSYKLRLLNMGYTEEQSEQLSSILLEMFLYEKSGTLKHKLMEPEPSNYGWYVYSCEDMNYFLHSDGEVYRSTHHAGEYTGYFKTEQEAINAKYKYENSK